ncbi:MAG: M3 family oligoendopeptidase, partial [Clostridia bacterium]|nr:M3 family oligoendopeptidase [Clostridia bacterium]
MKLSEMVYKRPDIEQVKADLTKFTEDFKNAATFEEADAIFAAMDKYQDTLETMMSLCYIRHTINTKDEFYEKEQDWFDENTPVFMEYSQPFTLALIASPFRPQFEE